MYESFYSSPRNMSASTRCCIQTPRPNPVTDGICCGAYALNYAWGNGQAKAFYGKRVSDLRSLRAPVNSCCCK